MLACDLFNRDDEKGRGGAPLHFDLRERTSREAPEAPPERASPATTVKELAGVAGRHVQHRIELASAAMGRGKRS